MTTSKTTRHVLTVISKGWVTVLGHCYLKNVLFKILCKNKLIDWDQDYHQLDRRRDGFMAGSKEAQLPNQPISTRLNISQLTMGKAAKSRQPLKRHRIERFVLR